MAATVELPTPTIPSLAYRPHLDGLRAIAVLMVFVFHAARPAMPAGFIGVDVFFVLSGYLITSVLLSQYEGSGRIRLGEFYSRRMRRLTPAVVLLVVAVAIREMVWGSILEAGIRLREILATLFYVANWNLIALSDDYFAQGANVSPLRHTWSLAVEEQFYLLWPALLIGLLFLGRGRRKPIIWVTVAIATVSAILMALLYDPSLVTRVYYGTDARIHQPLMGAALALAFHGRQEHNLSPGLAAIAAWGGLVILGSVALLLRGPSVTYFMGGSGVVAVATVAHMLGVESKPGGHAARLLGAAPLRYLGKISYGFYLWHWPVVVWLRAPDGASFLDRRIINLLQFGITLAVSAASYALVEDPIRSRRALRSLRRPLAVIAVGLAALSTTAFMSSAMLTRDESDVAAAALADHSVQACPDDPRPCVKVQGDNPRAPVIALVGDSTAQAYDPAMKEIAEQHDLTYVQAAVGGCSIGHRLLATGTDGELHKPSNFTCWEELPSIYTEVLERWDPTVIIATSWNETNPHVTGGTLVESGTDRHLSEVMAALRAAATTLTSQGAHLVFIDIMPGGPSVSCLDRASADDPACQRPRPSPDPFEPYNGMFATLADQMPKVSDISLTSLVCSDTVCPIMRDGIVMRYDGGHLTGTASERLAVPLATALSEEGIDLGPAISKPAG